MTTVDELVVLVRADSSGVTSGMNQAGQAVTSFSDRISKSAVTLQGFGNIGLHAMGMLDRMEISSMSVQNALMSLEDAQVRYNQTLENFGEGSEQAAIAQNSLERATNQYQAAQMRANLSLASMGITMVGMIPQITTLATKIKEVGITTIVTTASIKAMAPELLIISAVAGGAYFLMTSSARAAEEANIGLGNSFTFAADKATTLKNSIIELNNAVNAQKNGETENGRRQTPMDQYLEYHIRDEDRSDILPAGGTRLEPKPESKTATAEEERDKVIAEYMKPPPITSAEPTPEYLKSNYMENPYILALLMEHIPRQIKVDPMDALRSNAPRSPTYGADRAGAITVNVNMQISTNLDESGITRAVGQGIKQGFDPTTMKSKVS